VVEDKERWPHRDVPPGVVYLVEFEAGEELNVHKNDVERAPD
jgi:hypothetical protein